MAVPVCVLWVLAAPTLVWLATYFLPLLYVALRGPQDLKKKYGASWALVTVRAAASVGEPRGAPRTQRRSGRGI